MGAWVLINACWYNYTPSGGAYPKPGGGDYNVYFYPRKNTCILGGIREYGTVDPQSGKFIPWKEPVGEFVTIGDVHVPKPIIDINRDLVRQLTGVELGNDFTPLIGYRHIHTENGKPKLRIESVARHGVNWVDCVGFGGAGVTLSWGAAVKAVGLAEGGLDQEAVMDRLNKSSNF